MLTTICKHATKADSVEHVEEMADLKRRYPGGNAQARVGVPDGPAWGFSALTSSAVSRIHPLLISIDSSWRPKPNLLERLDC